MTIDGRHSPRCGIPLQGKAPVLERGVSTTTHCVYARCFLFGMKEFCLVAQAATIGWEAQISKVAR